MARKQRSLLKPIPPNNGGEANHMVVSRHDQMKRFARKWGVSLHSIFFDSFSRPNSTEWE